MEDKQKICDALRDALRLTYNQEDLEGIKYDEAKETATLHWLNGNSQTVNVAMDSGTAMIRDIMKAID